MKKLLMLIAAMIMCNAYGEDVYWLTDGAMYEKTTCNSGDNVTMPTQGNPTKTGYRFIGWKELTAPTNWKEMLWFSFTSYNKKYGSGPIYWSITGNYGTLIGEWRCSSSGGATAPNSCLNNAEGCQTNSSPIVCCDSEYNWNCSDIGTNCTKCWCKGHQAIFNGNTTNVSPSTWVGIANFSQATMCADNCAQRCADRVQNYSGFRRAVFGVTQ